MSPGHRSRYRLIPSPEAREARLLHHELFSASHALGEALLSPASASRRAKLHEAREALEAFHLLQRTSPDFVVPHDIRRRIRWALDALDEDHVELAQADLARAGGELERWMIRRLEA